MRRVWDLESGELSSALEGHAGHVNTVSVAGKHILSGSEDMTVR